MLVPSRNRICFNQIFCTAISTSWTLERGPCRKPSGGGSDRYSLSQKALRLISECSSTGTSFRLSQSGGSSGDSDSWLEIIRKRAKQVLSVQFGAILGLIVSFFHLIAQTMRRRSTPRSRLRRRRIAEFELAKPRIHPAEFYGGNEDDSARRSSTRSYPSLETMTGNLGQFESDWWRPVSESSLLLTEPIHGVGAGRLTAF